MAKASKQKKYVRRYKKGTVQRKKGTKFLWILFYYFKERVEFSTGDPDTPENFDFWERWLDDTMEAIEEGTFRYAEAFPNAPPEKKAYFAGLERSEVKTDPSDVTFEEFARYYLKTILPRFKSVNKRDDFTSRIEHRLIPFFGKMPLSQNNRTLISEFISHLNQLDRNE